MSAEAAARILGPRARLDAPLGELTTYRVGGRAALGFTIDALDDLRLVARAVRETGIRLLVLGRGSNMLVADRGFDGLAVTLGQLGTELEVDGTRVMAGGGVLLPVLARRTVAAALTGLEWAVGVPGTVGGGVRMNAGGHGSDIARTLVEVHLADLLTGEHGSVPAPDLALRFRSSDVQDHHVVLDATFALARGDREASEAELSDIVRWRREHQPGGQNCGSVFVNPVPGEVSAGLLIDRLGLRGRRLGTAHVSEKHANFIQAGERGSAADVLALIDAVRDAVARETGVELRCEVRLVGFDAGEERE